MEITRTSIQAHTSSQKQVVRNEKGTITDTHGVLADLTTLVDVPAMAQFLAVPKGYVYDLVKHHELPSVRVGKYVRFSLPMVQRWLEARMVPSPHPENVDPQDRTNHTIRQPRIPRGRRSKGQVRLP